MTTKKKKHSKLWLVDHKVKYKKFGSPFLYFAFWKSGGFKKCSMKVSFLKKLVNNYQNCVLRYKLSKRTINIKEFFILL